MSNRLADAVSPYLRQHAENPVDWWPWGEAALAEAERRDLPLLISIGYATCHWCHVMARESFEDPALAAYLNAHFVPVKVDREEHPDVDASYLAAAGAFTRHLGWPLTIFATPAGGTFFAGTYFPPSATGGIPSFREVLESVVEAWTERRDQVLATGGGVVEAIQEARAHVESPLPGETALGAAVGRIAGFEDPEFGGFGTAPKFPVAPVLRFLVERALRGDAAAAGLVDRTLSAMAVSPLRDAVEGGFFRYAVQRDWSEPHYERMLGDNAQLLDVYAALGEAGLPVVEGIADFLLQVLRVPGGAFASAQNSESQIDGASSEGGYYALDAEERARLDPPALDDKVLSGLNGLAIGALAEAGQRFERPDWIEAAAAAATEVLATQYRGGVLSRASLEGRVSDAVATLEDSGALAAGLLRLALATGEARWAVVARELVEACVAPDGAVRAPAGADPVLASRGLVVDGSLEEGALPSGRSAIADAALRLAALSGDEAHRAIAESVLAPLGSLAPEQPISFGGALTVLGRLAAPVEQLVVVTGRRDRELESRARAWGRPAGALAIVTPEQAAAFAKAGFELFTGRVARDGVTTAYLCERFVCALPVGSAQELSSLLTPEAPPR